MCNVFSASKITKLEKRPCEGGECNIVKEACADGVECKLPEENEIAQSPEEKPVKPCNGATYCEDISENISPEAPTGIPAEGLDQEPSTPSTKSKCKDGVACEEPIVKSESKPTNLAPASLQDVETPTTGVSEYHEVTTQEEEETSKQESVGDVTEEIAAVTK